MKKHQKKLLIRNIGNVLMLIPIFVLLYIYYPLLFIYVAPPQLTPVPESGTYITIPKIKAQANIIENVNPWKESEYQEALKKGVAQAMGTSPVGSSSGTIYLFAHSSSAPWEITRNNTIFFKLDQLQKGDEIILTKNNKKQTFIVYDKKTVWPNDVQYLKNIQKNQLILQTCTPVGTALQRLLVFALPKS